MLSDTASKSPSVQRSLDISAAFDTLDHQRLLERVMDLFDFDSTVLQWLGSYFIGREQFVGAASCHSRTVKLFSNGKIVLRRTAGLGLRAAACHHLHNTGRQPHLHGIRYYQFADDTQLYSVIDTTSPTGLATLSTCVDAVTAWRIRNDLLNPTKSEVIVTSTRQQIAMLNQSGGSHDLQCGGSVTLGTSGPWSNTEQRTDFRRTHHRRRPCNFHLPALRHIRHLIDGKAANKIVCSIVCSRLDYCNSMLYVVTENNIESLQHVQNALARVVCGTPYRSSATVLRRSLH